MSYFNHPIYVWLKSGEKCSRIAPSPTASYDFSCRHALQCRQFDFPCRVLDIKEAAQLYVTYIQEWRDDLPLLAADT
jgi:hypothetical protein